MNGTGDGGEKAENFSGFVRPLVTIALVGTFCYGFIVGRINGETFALAVGGVITWWFKSRDDRANLSQDTPPPGTTMTLSKRITPTAQPGPTGEVGDPIATTIEQPETKPVPVTDLQPNP